MKGCHYVILLLLLYVAISRSSLGYAMGVNYEQEYTKENRG